MLTFSHLDKRHKLNKLDGVALMVANQPNGNFTTDIYTISKKNIGDIMFHLFFGW